MKIHNYNQETKEFTTSTNATINPLEKEKYLIPANATTKEPIALKDGFAVCFIKEADKWEYIEDNRNKTVYVKFDKSKIKVDYLGSIKTEHTLLVPKEFDKWDEKTGTWIEDTKSKADFEELHAKELKEKELKELTISNNTVLYDANQEAIGNMAAVVSIATATFQRAISVGIVIEEGGAAVVMSLADAYNYVYKQNQLQWKGADNKWHTIQLESLVETTQKAMTLKVTVLSKY